MRDAFYDFTEPMIYDYIALLAESWRVDSSTAIYPCVSNSISEHLLCYYIRIVGATGEMRTGEQVIPLLVR